MTPLRLLFVGSWLGLLVACTSDKVTGDEPGAGGETSSAGTSSGAGKGAGGNSEPSCPKGTNERGEAMPTLLGHIDGSIVDEQGQPTSSGLVQICGRDICLKAEVGNDGKLTENPARELDAPAVKWGDGFEWAKVALPLQAGDTDLGTLTATRLPEYADSVALTPGTTVTSGGVTLTLADDAQVVVNKLDYETAEQQGLRAAALPVETLTRLGQDFVVAYALSPLEARICPSPALSLENRPQLQPGTALELYLLGLDVEESWAPYGHWQHIGDGVVSDDGQSLEFADGLPLLTAIGVKVKP